MLYLYANLTNTAFAENKTIPIMAKIIPWDDNLLFCIYQK